MYTLIIYRASELAHLHLFTFTPVGPSLFRIQRRLLRPFRPCHVSRLRTQIRLQRCHVVVEQKASASIRTKNVGIHLVHHVSYPQRRNYDKGTPYVGTTEINTASTSMCAFNLNIG